MGMFVSEIGKVQVATKDGQREMIVQLCAPRDGKEFFELTLGPLGDAREDVRIQMTADNALRLVEVLKPEAERLERIADLESGN